MLADRRGQYARIVGEILSARRRKRIVKPQRVADCVQLASAYRPFRDFVMLPGRVHVVEILRIALSSDRRHRAVELIGREYHVAQSRISAVFAFKGVDSVHHDSRNCTHTRVSFAAGFALYKPRKQLKIGHTVIIFGKQGGRENVLETRDVTRAVAIKSVKNGVPLKRRALTRQPYCGKKQSL